MKRQAFGFLGVPLGVLVLVAATGCEVRTPVTTRDGGQVGDGDVTPAGCTPGSASVYCSGTEAVQCLADGSEGARTDCATSGTLCVQGLGCRTCRPNDFRCSGNAVEQCNADGTAWEARETCDAAAGQMCHASSGTCRSACDDAEASNSYIGCEYWPTPVANAVQRISPDQFDFAVVVANPQEAAATVTVTRNGASVATTTVPAGGLETIRLDWLDYSTAVTGGGLFEPPPTGSSSLNRGGAYRLVSTLPVTVYQFSPLEFESGGQFSYSNDASLLLPTHVMTGNYIAISERTRATSCSGETTSTPGFVTVVGVSETPVQVTVQLGGRVAASADGAVAAAGPGTTQTYTLNAGDVLQLASADVSTCTPGGVSPGQCGGFSDMTHCRVSDDYDLTGTEIRATGPVMVVGGHACAFMPYNRFACDHVEETIFPLETWGKDFVVSMAQPLRGEPNVVRVISGEDGNAVTFDPGSVHDPVTLNRGQVLEFEARADFRVTGSGPLAVAQFLVGQNYAGGIETEGAGDPAMSFAIPTEQFRSEYTFLAPNTFTESFVNVVAPDGVEVMLSSNGATATAVTGWTPVGASGLRAVRVEIPGGSHQITASQPFGIVVYGYASYTSYMYPGGLDLEQINIF